MFAWHSSIQVHITGSSKQASIHEGLGIARALASNAGKYWFDELPGHIWHQSIKAQFFSASCHVLGLTITAPQKQDLGLTAFKTVLHARHALQTE